eukprot:SM000085S23292  [mRNA]  locus=s85:476130:482338:- [translate_table: standard]
MDCDVARCSFSNGKCTWTCTSQALTTCTVPHLCQPSKKEEKKTKKAAAPAEEEPRDAVDPETVPGERKRLAPQMAKAYSPRAVEARRAPTPAQPQDGAAVLLVLSANERERGREGGEGEVELMLSATLRPLQVVRVVGKVRLLHRRPGERQAQVHDAQVIPPPNVTGALHIGHALTSAVEDAVVRWRRMAGWEVCWVPGVDHAGIATQVVVEKKLMRERGATRHDLGRDAFVREVWKWKEEYGNRILMQQRRLGASLDWTRECFTMDAKLSKAVTAAFVQLHDRGHVYRDNRLVNWDCVLRTAVSDIEVDYQDIKARTAVKVPGYDEPVEFGALTQFAYVLVDPPPGGPAEIVVATTRPETMLGDTAVAVHPGDARYKALHGHFAVHPFIAGRRIPIIADEMADPELGTGAVKNLQFYALYPSSPVHPLYLVYRAKCDAVALTHPGFSVLLQITPAHDPKDFACGRRHGLDFINIFTDDGCINSNGGEFSGQRRFDARKSVIRALQDKGLYRGVADNEMRLAFCSRSKDVIEPMIKPQWYVRMETLGAAAMAAAADGRLEILPPEHIATWNRWLEGIRDWCISRQLWWGHQIPAWYAALPRDANRELGASADRWVVAHDEAEAWEAARHRFGGEVALTRDPDVLDTWFSSGLFPFSVFGWPDASAELGAFYPTALLETGHDILFFWVARMVMLSMELTGKVPFKQVFLHAMVRDAHGRKMSKSLGNVVDPLQVIDGVTLAELHEQLEGGNLDPREVAIAKEGQRADFPNGIAECGCDALRFALLAYTAQSVNINLDIQRVVGYRLWCNKLWNAIRFAMLNLGTDFVPSSPPPSPDSLPFECRWILSTLNSTIEKTVALLEAYDFANATTAVYAWWQYRLCDVFIELIKPTMSADGGDELKQATQDTLHACLDNGLRLLHPFMPFVTEELWQRLPKRREENGGDPPPSIMLSPYPTPHQEWSCPEVEAEMTRMEGVARSIRSLRTSYNLQPKQKPKLFLLCKNEATEAVMKMLAPALCTMATLSSAEILEERNAMPAGCAVTVVDETVTAYLDLRGLLDPSTEIEKLHKKQEDLTRQQEQLVKKMEAAGYEKVPAAVREENTGKAARLAAELESISEATANFQQLLIEAEADS